MTILRETVGVNFKEHVQILVYLSSPLTMLTVKNWDNCLFYPTNQSLLFSLFNELLRHKIFLIHYKIIHCLTS